MYLKKFVLRLPGRHPFFASVRSCIDGNRPEGFGFPVTGHVLCASERKELVSNARAMYCALPSGGP